MILSQEIERNPGLYMTLVYIQLVQVIIHSFISSDHLGQVRRHLNNNTHHTNS